MTIDNYLYNMSEYSMAEAMRQFLKQSRLKGNMLALQITEVWEQIMGKTIARYTDNIEIHGTTSVYSDFCCPVKTGIII